MTRRQLFKNFGFSLAGMLALPLFGKPGKVSDSKLQLPGNPPVDCTTVGFSQTRAPSGELIPIMVADVAWSAKTEIDNTAPGWMLTREAVESELLKAWAAKPLSLAQPIIANL